MLLSERQAVKVKEARGMRVQRIPEAALEILQQHEGEVVQACVSRVFNWGVFVDVDVDMGQDEGGATTVTGLVPVQEVSWLPNAIPFDLYQEGDIVVAQLLHVDMQQCKVSLSFKALQPDPLLASLERMLPASEESEGGDGGLQDQRYGCRGVCVTLGHTLGRGITVLLLTLLLLS